MQRLVILALDMLRKWNRSFLVVMSSCAIETKVILVFVVSFIIATEVFWG